MQAFAETLDRAGAAVAARYYERAILACLADESAYQAFVSGAFTDDNALKATLQLLSIEYFREGISFDQESASALSSVHATPGLRVGTSAAHSGASSTYAHLGQVREEWRIPATEYLEMRFPATLSSDTPAVPVQASLRRQGRDAGLVGARFTPKPQSSEIVVRVAVGQSRSSDSYDTVGLSREEAKAVLEGIAAHATGAPFVGLGPGQLDVLWATSHPVDGSESGFRRLAGSLVALLSLRVDADANAIASAWRRQDESVRSARDGDRG